MEFEYKYKGIYGNTDEGLPYIGEYKDLPNCYFSLDVVRNGILYATIAFKLLRDLYFNCDVPELEIFRFDR